MLLGIDPKVDYAFKYLFGREVNLPILIDVLESVLGNPPGARIHELELLNPFNPKESLDDKLSILDIKARDETGRQFNVEMQMLAVPSFDKRILYYAAKLYQQQFREGQKYAELRPTISISFLNHVLFPGVASYHLEFGMIERNHHFSFSQDLALHILELPKFRKTAVELNSGLDIWLYFLRNAERMNPEALPVALEQPLVKRAMEELQMLTQTDLERERYEARLKAQSDLITSIDAARREGREEGRESGRAEEKIATILFCERLLHEAASPVEALRALSLKELADREDELQAKVLKREKAD